MHARSVSLVSIRRYNPSVRAPRLRLRRKVEIRVPSRARRSLHSSMVDVGDASSGGAASSFDLVEYEASSNGDGFSLISASLSDVPSPIDERCAVEHVTTPGSISLAQHRDQVLLIGCAISTLTINHNVNPAFHGDIFSAPIYGGNVGGESNTNCSKHINISLNSARFLISIPLYS